MTDLHPATRRAYIAVMPSDGAFTDIWASYHAVAQARTWLDVVRPDRFHDLLSSVRGEDVTFVHWAPSSIDPALLPEDRRALVLAVYSEALDPDRSTMLPDHLRDWERFARLAPSLDGFFAHTPKMVSSIREETSLPGFLLPVGWHQCMGSPKWSVCKGDHDAVFAGSLVGRRVDILPALRKQLKLDVLMGVYGPNLYSALNKSKANLYVAHSNVSSYSTWRIWQSLCSSAALVTESGDWWPMEASLCFRIPRVTQENATVVARFIRSLPKDEALQRAMFLHDALRHFTVDHCVDTYLVEETSELSR